MSVSDQHPDMPRYGTPAYWTWRHDWEEQKLRATKERERESEKQKNASIVDDAMRNLGDVVALAERKRHGSLRLEQNLGCELPVCVANRRDVNKVSIRFVTEEGLEWQLTRAADSKLPSPEHYKYWLWFLDRCHKAVDQGATLAPRIALNPVELARIFNAKPDGRWYRDVDDAFNCFARMIVSAHTVFYEASARLESDTTLGTLCFYSSWKKAGGYSSGGWIAPGPLLWSSIRSGYLLSISLDQLLLLDTYLAQRLYTHLSKHCRPASTYTVALRKLLPKIPMKTRLESANAALRPHHEALVRVGFLAKPPKFVGRGQSRQVIYERR